MAPRSSLSTKASGLSPEPEEARFCISRFRLADWAIRRVLLAHNPLVLGLRKTFGKEKHLDAGTVSVIVPFKNTAPYLRAALESIRLQRYWDLEVILVDDASADGSSTIAKEFTRIDPRFTQIKTKGVGPGAARNVGIARATGNFLAFVDGDDILPIGAISKQVSSLMRSGSDFVVGGFEHVRGDERWRSPWVAREHHVTREGTTLDQVPGLTRNVFAWNKLFRRGFFDRAIGGFPEGVIYEDQVPTAQAFVSAGRFDVLAETVYHWRQRGTGDSITQRRSSTEHLAARLNAFAQTEAIYSGQASSSVYRHWLVKSLYEDMIPFIEASQAADASYRDQLRAHCKIQLASLTIAEQESAHDWNRRMIESYIALDPMPPNVQP